VLGADELKREHGLALGLALRPRQQLPQLRRRERGVHLPLGQAHLDPLGLVLRQQGRP
jgi:hypothetical protein